MKGRRADVIPSEPQPADYAREQRARTGRGETLNPSEARDASDGWRSGGFLQIAFGNQTISPKSLSFQRPRTGDSRLCVPVSRQVCPYRVQSFA